MSLSPFDIGSLVAIISLIVTVVKLYFDQRKAREQIDLSKQYLQTLSKIVESHIKTQESQQQIEKQKLEWQKLKDFGSALWEIIKHEDEEQSE